MLERIAPYVGQITAVDVSEAMNAELRQKLSRLACEVEILPVDLERVEIDRQFDGIVSSMTMHHIENVAAMFGKFRRMLKHGGFIAIADLDQEDGAFHSEDTGIHHFGFVRAAIAKLATDAEFERVHTRTASMIRKDERDYAVFLLTAVRSQSQSWRPVARTRRFGRMQRSALESRLVAKKNRQSLPEEV